MRILVGVDGSPCSDAVIAEIGSSKWPTGSQILVVSVYELAIPTDPKVWAISAPYHEQMRDFASREARSIIQRAVRRLRAELGNSVTITGKFIPDAPRLVIESEARSWRADLTVVGSPRLPALEEIPAWINPASPACG